ncbi:MAG: alpha/beta fold hydrolase, partial [Burkholderiales bacterium]
TAEALAGRIPGARLAVIRGAGHVSNLDQPERFNAAVLAFLRAHRDRASEPSPATIMRRVKA